jgi:hypothetical protein
MKRREAYWRVARAIACDIFLASWAQVPTRQRRIGVALSGVDPGGPPPGATETWKRAGWIEAKRC